MANSKQRRQHARANLRVEVAKQKCLEYVIKFLNKLEEGDITISEGKDQAYQALEKLEMNNAFLTPNEAQVLLLAMENDKITSAVIPDSLQDTLKEKLNIIVRKAA